MNTDNHHLPEWNRYTIDTNIDRYMSLLLEALERKASRHPSYSLSFYPPESIQSAYFGERSDGVHWTFEVYGLQKNPEYDPAYNFSHTEYQYTLQTFYLQLTHYTLFQQKTHCGCGTSRIHTTLCLPDNLLSSCNSIMKISNAMPRQALLDSFSKELLVFLSCDPLSSSPFVRRR